MSSATRERWHDQLRRPTEAFFGIFGQRAGGPPDLAGATVEALEFLIPVVDWQGYLPQVPHGLLGTWAAWRLRPLLREDSFRRLLALQLLAFAREARAGKSALAAVGSGSGSWTNIQAAFSARRPSLAYGEALGIRDPTREDFRRAQELAMPDMANVGHKPVTAWAMGDFFERLGSPPAAGRKMLGLALWLGASEPRDLFWRQRAEHRLGKACPPLDPGPAREEEAHAAAARDICDLGLVELLDRWCPRLAGSPRRGDLLSMLSLAGAEKQLDARRDLEGKTSWNFVFLASLSGEDSLAFAQAAALVNLFPTDEESERIRPKAPRMPSADPATAFLEALLDGEAPESMFLAEALLRERGPEAALRVLAEASTRNDPVFNHSQQVLAVAAGAELLGQLTPRAAAAVLTALAKSHANSQGSGDLGRLADQALGS